ncbi:MAG: hypothetical protein ABFS32_03860 [Bacteroidota bacterium]
MSETDYSLRYERGSFKSGYCILNTEKVAVVNKFFTPEGKINCLLDIIKSIDIDTEKLSEKNQAFYATLLKSEMEL